MLDINCAKFSLRIIPKAISVYVCAVAIAPNGPLAIVCTLHTVKTQTKLYFGKSNNKKKRVEKIEKTENGPHKTAMWCTRFMGYAKLFGISNSK